MLVLRILSFGAVLFYLSCNQEQRNKYAGEPLSSEDSIQNKMEADSGVLTDDDKRFVKSVAFSSLVEMEAGKLSLEKTDDSAIQSFGRLLVNEHKQLAKDLKEVVAQRDVEFPTTLDNAHKNKIAHLSTKSGRAFEMAFIKLMIDNHTASLRLYDEAGAHAKDVHIQSFANKNIPIIREHLRIANQLNDNLK
jgi:putative membrane protein